MPRITVAVLIILGLSGCHPAVTSRQVYPGGAWAPYRDKRKMIAGGTVMAAGAAIVGVGVGLYADSARFPNPPAAGGEFTDSRAYGGIFAMTLGAPFLVAGTVVFAVGAAGRP